MLSFSAQYARMSAVDLLREYARLRREAPYQPRFHARRLNIILHIAELRGVDIKAFKAQGEVDMLTDTGR